jgi:hypothetical protein
MVVLGAIIAQDSKNQGISSSSYHAAEAELIEILLVNKILLRTASTRID